MVGYGGNAFADISLKGRAWIFDAVYTPLKTPFLKEGEAAGVEMLSGYELFLYQGIPRSSCLPGTTLMPVSYGVRSPNPPRLPRQQTRSATYWWRRACRAARRTR